MIIAINNNKGGSLKTTTVTNLAGVLASQKKKVLIVDADSQSNVALSFRVNPDNCRTTLYDALTDAVPVEDTIVKVHEYIDIIPSNADLISFDFEVIGNPEDYPSPFTMMKEALQHLDEKYDYILIDTPPSLSLIVGNAFALADKVLIPYTPEFYSMRSLISVVKTINEFKEEINPKLEVLGIVKTIVKANTNLHTVVSQQTLKFAKENGIKVFEAEVPNTIQFANAIAYNKVPATMMPKKYDKSAVYFDLWEEIEKSLGKEAVR
ncbi:AAA family ATPase [Cytobacillus firmus]|nr:AAA family ATPase [Cytobacillus firmus]